MYVRDEDGSQVCTSPWNEMGCFLTFCIACFPFGNWLWYSKSVCWVWQGDSMKSIWEFNSQPLTGLGYGQLTNESVDNVEKFVCKILDPPPRSQILIKFDKENDPGMLPSTSDALKLHIRWAHYQTTIWLNVTVPSPGHIDPETCRSVRDPFSNQLKPKLLLLEPIPKSPR